MCKHGGTPSRHGTFPMLAVTSPPGAARGRFVGGQKSGLVGCKLPPLFKFGAFSCSITGATPGRTTGRISTNETTYLPAYLFLNWDLYDPGGSIKKDFMRNLLVAVSLLKKEQCFLPPTLLEGIFFSSPRMYFSSKHRRSTCCRHINPLHFVSFSCPFSDFVQNLQQYMDKPPIRDTSAYTSNHWSPLFVRNNGCNVIVDQKQRVIQLSNVGPAGRI